MARARYGLELVNDIAGRRIQFEQEPLFAFFYVEIGCRINKPEPMRFVDNLYNSTHVDRPEGHCLRLHRNQLACNDPPFGIGHKGPSEIEHRPTFEGMPRIEERLFAMPNRRH